MLEYEDFEKAVSAIISQDTYDRGFSDKMSAAFPDAFKANLLYYNEYLRKALIDLLTICMKDDSKMIDFFVNEIQNGFGQVYLNDGKDKLETIEQLFTYLKQ